MREEKVHISIFVPLVGCKDYLPFFNRFSVQGAGFKVWQYMRGEASVLGLPRHIESHTIHSLRRCNKYIKAIK
jgi:hypothetical protein